VINAIVDRYKDNSVVMGLEPSKYNVNFSNVMCGCLLEQRIWLSVPLHFAYWSVLKLRWLHLPFSLPLSLSLYAATCCILDVNNALNHTAPIYTLHYTLHCATHHPLHYSTHYTLHSQRALGPNTAALSKAVLLARLQNCPIQSAPLDYFTTR